jgi:ribonuclease Z
LKILFLGTGSAIPTLKRNVSSVAVSFIESGKFWLLDCGEGTQHQIRKTSLKLPKLEKIFISHLHGDHIFGLPGLLATRGMEGARNKVEIYGPEGITSFIRETQRITHTYIPYELEIHTLSTHDSLSIVCENENYIVRQASLKHNIKSYGYSIQRKGAVHFLVEKAHRLNIPEGPLYGALKRGETIKLSDGRTFHGKDFLSKPIPGKKIAYCSDTAYCENSIILAESADLLIHEATFTEQDEKLAKKSSHSTIEDACEVAKKANVKQLILTHFSSRYNSMKELLAQAQSIFPNVMLAKDFMGYKV